MAGRLNWFAANPVPQSFASLFSAPCPKRQPSSLPLIPLLRWSYEENKASFLCIAYVHNSVCAHLSWATAHRADPTSRDSAAEGRAAQRGGVAGSGADEGLRDSVTGPSDSARNAPGADGEGERCCGSDCNCP